eukprot:TRINITY_DN3095_c0_g1_i1.p1 TRINITY_DN3095_c0_g1~~TRINITY_DN3095_c0_g1_i1.p1  ORF type:complete len:540 (+),score=109.05 TRINITY_DN3095_c0_g1_i1:69-1622(+)
MASTAATTLPASTSLAEKQPGLRPVPVPIPSSQPSLPAAQPPPQTAAISNAGQSAGDHKQSPASIVNKPARGWLHPDNLIAKDGINYAVRYIGYLEVNTSMKILDFDTRSAIAKESISRVCEENQGMSQQQVEERRKRVDRNISNMLGNRVILSGTGSNVQLTITSLSLKLSDLDSGNVILQHEMPMISFASGGDSDSLNFIAYVAKDKMGVRGCYVLYCGGGLAQDVITTIGQAFELRFKEFLKKTPGPRPPPLPTLRQVPMPPLLPDDPEYYNDLPGKAPPPTTPSNLIDFNTEIGGVSSGKCQYVNTDIVDQHNQHSHHQQQQQHVSNSHHQHSGGPAPTRSGRPRDPFDMSPFALNPPGGGIPSPTGPAPVTGLNQGPPHQTPGGSAPISGGMTPQSANLGATAPTMAMKAQLTREPWYHGAISRKDAEALLTHDGDFLVRESQGSVGQYVLTGMQGNNKKHLLLVDPEGIVRTRDRTFQSVSHLIEYHRKNNLPIISAESALRLQRPVNKIN